MFTLRIPHLGRGAIHTSLIAIAAVAVGAVLSATITHNVTIPKASAPHEIAPIDPTCTSSLPCIEYDNNGTGPGIRGISVGGNGLAGATKFNSTSLSNSREGLIGNDISTSGAFNAGVRGLSVRGIGVAGQSTNGSGVAGQSTSGSGVAGQSTSATGVVGNGSTGVAGSGSTFGVSGSGSTGVIGSGNTGIEGHNTSAATSDALFANGSGGNLFRGNNSASLDVFVVTDAGDTTIAGQFTGGPVNALGGSFGVNAVGTQQAVSAQIQGSGGDAVNASNSVTGTNLFRGFNTVAGKTVFQVDDGGNVFAHSFNATLAATIVQKTSTGQKVGTYVPQVSQPSLEDFGEAQLVGGVANVGLDPAFAAAIDRKAGYLVMVTPEGDCRGLYVAQKAGAAFSVRELQGGRSTIAFSYRIVAKPYGASTARLPAATYVPHGFDTQVRSDIVLPRAVMPRAKYHAKPPMKMPSLTSSAH
jgi:hypothetical protein